MTTVQLVNPNSVSKQRAATPVVPIFRDSAFDAEATGALGSAYDIACRALHPQGQPPVIQEQLARKIIEAAARGERDPERLATAALAILGPFHRDVTRRFGLVPNFFMSAPEAPEILEKLGTSPGRLISTIRYPRFSKSVCSFSCRASARSAIASFVTAGFWLVTAIHRATLRRRHKPLGKCSGF
jgi:hypothetical protein